MLFEMCKMLFVWCWWELGVFKWGYASGF